MKRRRDLVGGLLIRDGEILLGRRSPEKRSWPDSWDMPGGHVEEGETFEGALVRELEEEIGIVPTRFTPLADYALARGVLYRIFRVDGWSGGEPRLNNDEHVLLTWCTPAEAQALRPLAVPDYGELFRTLAHALEQPSPQGESRR